MVAVRREWMVGGSSRAPPLRAGPRSARTPRAMKPMPGERERGWNAHLLERLHPVVDPDILAKPSPEELRHGAPRASQTRASATLPRRAVLCPALESRAGLTRRGGLLGTARRGGCQNGTDHDFPIRRPVARARGSCRRLSLRDSSARRAFPTGQRRSARTMDATQTMSETARSSFLGDTMPHILPVRAFSPRRASFPAPTSHFWHSRAGDWDALASHLGFPRPSPASCRLTRPSSLPRAGRRIVHARRRGRQGVHPTRVRRRDPAPHHPPPRDPKVRSPSDERRVTTDPSPAPGTRWPARPSTR